MYVDLTMSIDKKTPTYPGDQKQDIQQIATVEKDGWNEKRLTFSSHFSTHIDAPSHMLKSGKTLSDFSMEKFIGEALVLDVRGKKHVDLSQVKEGDIVFFFTGHSKNAYNDKYYENNPIIMEKTAKELIDKKINIIGIDSFSPDNEPFNVHKMLFKEDILIVENLVKLDKLANKRFQCYIFPLKIQDADGAPCRVVAFTN